MLKFFNPIIPIEFFTAPGGVCHIFCQNLFFGKLQYLQNYMVLLNLLQFLLLIRFLTKLCIIMYNNQDGGCRVKYNQSYLQSEKVSQNKKTNLLNNIELSYF